MKVKTGDIIWGVFLILMGVIVLAQQLDWFSTSDTLSLVIVLTILTLIALVGYFASGWRNWWLLFPASILGSSALVVWLVEEAGTRREVAGGVFLMIISIPFWIGFLVDRKRSWWALLTAGVTGTLALVILIDFSGLSEAAADRLIPVALFGGLAATLTALYLKRDRYPTQWAIYPAAALSVSAVIIAIFGSATETVWASLLIALGTVIIAGVVKSRKKKTLAEPPTD